MSAYDNFDYIGVGLSSQKIENKHLSNTNALILNTGKNNLYKNIGIELEGSIQLDKSSTTINGISSDLKFWYMGMYGTYLWKLDNSFAIKPRFGIVYKNIKSSLNTSNNNPTNKEDENKLSLSAGIGISYKLTEKSELFTNYTKFEDDIEHLTFGAEFKF
jgi:opacity protein-like surface antigen